MQSQNPIVPEQIISQLLESAEREHASDVHLEPRGEEIIVRFRVDGILKEIARMEIGMLETIISRLKILGQLDITNHSNPQEGHFELVSSIEEASGDRRILNVRISIFPTIYGESTVLRLLNRKELLIPLVQMGFDASDRARIESLIQIPYGMLLATGPAGSGKTTFLYSVINILAKPEKNIITLEDPVEYHLQNVRQSQIHPERGFTFETGMRSILRQDPDVIMIGEIRDGITAETAIHASLTGRLLLSTLHANSSVGTIARLIDMKIDPALIAYALNGIVAQRLVRRVCQACKTPYSPEPHTLELLGVAPDSIEFVQGRGCDVCSRTGFQGRIGIFEVLAIDNDIRKAIAEHEPIEKIQILADQKGLRSLRSDGIRKISAGLTTPEEILRISIV
jgi:type II secretory ATPase GspE/PulE/Tfp pilus assembly ATPase PilB-like protein